MEDINLREIETVDINKVSDELCSLKENEKLIYYEKIKEDLQSYDILRN